MLFSLAKSLITKNNVLPLSARGRKASRSYHVNKTHQSRGRNILIKWRKVQIIFMVAKTLRNLSLQGKLREDCNTMWRLNLMSLFSFSNSIKQLPACFVSNDRLAFTSTLRPRATAVGGENYHQHGLRFNLCEKIWSCHFSHDDKTRRP